MKIIDNLVIADKNRLIKTNDGLFKEVELGNVVYIEDGIKHENSISLENIKEVYVINIENDFYEVLSTTYPEIITELIRLKYTLDDELALMANSRIGDDKYEMEFLNWRKLCKEAAKRVLNE